MPAIKRARRPDRDEELRRRYAALRVHHPFERIAEVFEPADLSFLLTDTDSLKVTYLADHKDLPRGVRLRQWLGAGLIAAHARLASNAGYTPQTLEAAIELALSMGPETSRQEWLEILIKHPTTRRFLEACASAGIDGTWLSSAIRSGASIQLLRDLRKLGVAPRYMTKEVVAGCLDANLIYEWFRSGISPRACAQFIATGLSPNDALAWLQAGFIPEEIVKFVSARKSIVACKATLPNVPYSKVFRRVGAGRFGIAGPYVQRVWRAVCALDVPSAYQSSMFSTAREEASFLDGGYLSVSGYGFGSHSSTLVKGELALRFLCYRIGVRPPRGALFCKEALDHPALETKFRDWRESALQRA